MIPSYLLMFAFGFVLLASWAGWGAALERLALGRRVGDRALHAGWGLAWSIVAGGVLNLAGWVTPATTGLLVAVGVALLVGELWLARHRVRARGRRWWAAVRHRPGWGLVGLLLLAMLLSVYAANVCTKRFNHHDDLQAYLVYPAQMIQTGAMGPDPYSERRMLALGGMSFLHAIVLGVADSRYVVLVDPGVSLLLAVALLLGMARDARASPWVAALAVLVLLAIPPPRVNVTSLVSGLALFLTLFRTLSRVTLRAPESPGGAFLLALVAAGACSLKSSFVPACALTLVGSGLLVLWRSRAPRGVVRGLALSAVLTLLFLAPWMISLEQSSGTPLFPFLGRGFHGSAHGGFWTFRDSLASAWALPALGSALTDPRVLPVWVLGAALLLRGRGRAARGALVPFVLAALASYLALALLNPKPAYRYSWAFLFAGLLALIVYSASATALRRGRGDALRSVAPLGLAVGLLAVAHAEDSRYYWAAQPRSIGAAFNQSRSAGFKRRWARRYARMQQAVPRGATLLTRLEYPFVLDFNRHLAFVADYPGAASPTGMPLRQGSERLAAYLCAQGIAHVAYSYRREADFSRAQWGRRLAPDVHPWMRSQARNTFDFQERLVELGRSRHRAYDDGDVFVIDLGQSAEGAPLECASARGTSRGPASTRPGVRRGQIETLAVRRDDDMTGVTEH